MKRFTVIFFTIFSLPCIAQQLPPGVTAITMEVVNDVPMTVIRMKPVIKFANPAAQRRFDRLARNVMKVYPIALEAERMFEEMEVELAKMPQASKRRVYVAQKEREIQKKYTPVLREMTFSQGKILIKLIDRQTTRTSYDILLEMRGRFRASIWQGVAKLFDADLNAAYDASGEDREIESIIGMIERGEL
jgi:hypothetical protein